MLSFVADRSARWPLQGSGRRQGQGHPEARSILVSSGTAHLAHQSYRMGVHGSGLYGVTKAVKRDHIGIMEKKMEAILRIIDYNIP